MSAADTDKPLLDFDAVRAMATGRWPEIHADLGIDYVLNKHQPCPGCRGTNRFRGDDIEGRGTFICSQGNGDNLAGDGFALIQHVRGCGALEAFEAVADVLGSDTLRKKHSEHGWRPSAPAGVQGQNNGSCTSAGTVTADVQERDAGKRTYALELWLRAIRDDDIVAAQGYVKRKGFEAAHGAGVADDVRCRLWEGSQRCLVVPIREHGTEKVIAVQAINSEGTKVTFGSMTAEDGTPGYLALGNTLDPEAPLFTCEGWADVVSLIFYVYGGNACGAIAFGKGRLEKVAEQFSTDMGRRSAIIGDRP